MSRHARHPFGSFGASASASASASAVCCVLALATPFAGAQTIADYSRVQRALLESAMTLAAARSAGVVVAAPASAASVPASAPTTSAPRLTSPPALPAVPAVQVSGVFAARGGAVAEVVVNATAYVLGVGQGVPGTAWHVETIAVDRVVLVRQGGALVADAAGVRRVFALPALR